MDTKGSELAFVADRIAIAGVPVKTVDVGTAERSTIVPDISARMVAATHPNKAARTAVFACGDRGEAVTLMSEALEAFMLNEHAAGRVAGVLGIGGSGGTSLITRAMRALPIGLPKVMVSTVASGNVAPYVGASDITMMYSVVDVAGLNAVSRRVLGNAAHAIVGMVKQQTPEEGNRRTLGMTMFGVTTTCVDQVRAALEPQGFDCLVFHATGTGGQAMEKMVSSGLIHGVLDITTTEVADEVVGGVFPAGPNRFDAILQKQIPYVLSLGALDMVNFGARETVPPQFAHRRLHVHNAQVTLMRSTVDENRRFGEWIAAKLNRSTAPVTLLIPEKGLSALDTPGKPFWDPEADAALFSALEESIEQTDRRRIVRLPHHINDAEFSQALVNEYHHVAAAVTGTM